MLKPERTACSSDSLVPLLPLSIILKKLAFVAYNYSCSYLHVLARVVSLLKPHNPVRGTFLFFSIFGDTYVL